ncbi:sensor histidine kinase [Niabella ginsengisoli]|uniref:histidine kinase n=1 Tax=Niabella ginsengisoli TaxID=522298 RepID=A0ABS9SJ24_9BACT|nr:ATP-binding protein [Niabella ginsengisoli]MCH5598368.1 ATP-binding protein [Niabella ginsengisoli]
MQKLSNDIVVILGASVFLLLITLFIIVLLMAYKKRDYKHLKEKRLLEEDFNSQLLHSQIEVQEQTFSQIGKELHDNVGQLLSTSRMLIGLAERKLKTPPDALLTANATIGEAINELRSLSKSLDKDWLSQFNLIDNLKTEVIRMNAGSSIKVSLEIQSEPDMPSSRQIILFRIIQEAIQNALKHSSCDHIAIHLNKNNRHIEIIVADDGSGFKTGIFNKGMGLKNMQYRTKLLGGSIRYQSTEKGTSIIILIPENSQQNED